MQSNFKPKKLQKANLRLDNYINFTIEKQKVIKKKKEFKVKEIFKRLISFLYRE